MDTRPLTAIAELKAARGLDLDGLADLLNCSKGHAHDLCSGRRNITVKLAHHLEAVTGKPWHEWLSAADDPPTDKNEDAAA